MIMLIILKIFFTSTATLHIRQNDLSHHVVISILVWNMTAMNMQQNATIPNYPFNDHKTKTKGKTGSRLTRLNTSGFYYDVIMLHARIVYILQL